MARKTSKQRIEAARQLDQGELAKRIRHPAVVAALQRIRTKASELKSHRVRLPQIQEELDELYRSDPLPEDFETRRSKLEQEQLKILSGGEPLFVDGEITPYPKSDPFLEDRKLCFDHGVVVGVFADRDGHPYLLFGVRPDVTLSSVKLLPQQLLPMPRWIDFRVDLNTARASRQAVIGEFEALLDHLLSAARHPLDPEPVLPKGRPRQAYKIREIIAMANEHEAGVTFTAIGKRFELDRTSVRDRVRWLYDRIGVAMPRRGKHLVAAPPDKRCKAAGNLPGCPDRQCADCPWLRDPELRKLVENDARWDQERVLPTPEWDPGEPSDEMADENRD
jgi:hypothetical protein